MSDLNLPVRPSCDLFCTVIDNLGDIGVCWRLARQLAAEHGWRVTLWVDDLPSFAVLCAQLDPQRAHQRLGDLEVRHWPPASAAAAADAPVLPDVFAQPGIRCADIVIEAFACELPPAYLMKMVARAEVDAAPVWINLEYLSAEDWVAGCHLQVSHHPRYPLRKTFFFQGLRPGSGGVVHERGLDAARRAFLADPAARQRLWASLGVPAPAAAHTVISLFGYENPAIATLLKAWSTSSQPVVCLVPQGRASGDVAAFFGQARLTTGQALQAGALTVLPIAFTDQWTYDQLLWVCDLNFVRGEDSFVRAQWAERPFVWHIYPQQELAHRPKLDAGIACYTAHLPAPVGAALNAFWQAWNTGDAGALDWQDFWQHRTTLAAHAPAWARELAELGDLAGNLAEYAENQLK